MAIDPSGKHATFINHSVSVAVQMKAAQDAWMALRTEWDALDYSHQITDTDFTGTAPYMNAATLQAFYVSQGNFVVFWNAGNGMNICAVMP